MKNNFEAEVNRQVERLQKKTCQTIESEVARKRIAWFKRNYKSISQNNPLSPRKAYEVIFFDYMGLSATEVFVLSETETEILWNSTNRCPTLEACRQLGLDTRRVCRAIYEKSTQALVSQLDPKLRFLRSYQEIRPYSPYCKERIIRVDFEHRMKIAVEEAKISKSEGNRGYGAVVVLGEHIVGKAHDTVITEKDPSSHAEVNAIRQAVHTLGEMNLSGAILFSTCEPCPMCSCLAVWANVTTIVYGMSLKEIAQPDRSGIIDISSKELVSKSPVMIEVIGNVLKNECKALYM